MTDERLKDSVARHMRQDFVRIRLDRTVGGALEDVRKDLPPGRIVYFYVVDSEDKLVGVVPTRRLLLSEPDARVASVMVTPALAIPSDATLADTLEFFLLHRLLAVPVVDAERRLVGVVDVETYTDEMSDLAHKDESDGFFQLVGVRLAEVQKASILAAFARRFPWLLCNIGGGLAAAFLAGAFQATLDQAIALALFIPVVLALAESVSIQSLSLTLQSQHGGARPKASVVLRSLIREIPIGALLGLSCGLLVAATAWLWKGDFAVTISILISILGSIVLATLFGLLVPTALRALRIDPRIASGPMTLAATDLATLFLYLGTATIALG